MLPAFRELHVLAVCAACLAASAASMVVGARLQRVRRVLAAVAALGAVGCVAWLWSVGASQSGWPLSSGAEVVVISAAAAVLWHLLYARSTNKAGEVVFHALASGLLVWGALRWPERLAPSLYDSGPQPWSFISRLLLALACGAVVEAGSLALVCLLVERRPAQQGAADHAPMAGGLLLVSFLLSTASLLAHAAGGLYARGIYWSWVQAESWMLALWLVLCALWVGITMAALPLQRLRGLTIACLVLVLLLFRSLGA